MDSVCLHLDVCFLEFLTNREKELEIDCGIVLHFGKGFESIAETQLGMCSGNRSSIGPGSVAAFASPPLFNAIDQKRQAEQGYSLARSSRKQNRSQAYHSQNTRTANFFVDTPEEGASKDSLM